jgi:two-component system, NarL family, invasion response regulator UvrY
MIRILLIEDHPIVRRGLKEILADEFKDAVFGEAGDSSQALQELHHRGWDAILLDINLPGRDGLDLLDEIHKLHPHPPVLVVSAYPEEEFAIRAFKLGAAGYLGKGQASDELVAAVRKLLNGGKYVTATLAERLASVLSSPAGSALHERLSARELQVLRLIASGKSIKDIAAALCLSEKTVTTYRTRIGEKLGMSTNVELTRYAFHNQLVQ